MMTVEVKDLKHINEIESPQNLGKKVRIRGIVASTSLPYSVPRAVTAVTKNGEEKKFEIESDSRINLQFVGVSDAIKYDRLVELCKARFLGEKIESVAIESERVIYWLKIKPQVFSLILVKKEDQEKVMDDEGFEYKSFDVFVVANEDHIKFQASTLIDLVGVPLPNPKTQLITFLASEISFPNEVNSFDAEKVRKLKTKLDSLGGVDQKIQWILDNFAIYAHLVNRSNMAFANFLCYFTPLRVEFDNNLVHGWGNVLPIGDSTTGKSETSRRMVQLLEAGTYITAETATNVGLLGSAVQTQNGAWMVDWGFLVIEDRKLLIIDGGHKLTKPQWAALAEAIRHGMVNIAKAAKGEAYARTRELVIANPLNRDTDNTQTMDNFMHSALAIETILDVVNIARLDLVVFARNDEVDYKEVNKLQTDLSDPELYLLKDALQWCWDGKARLEFEQDAMKEIIESSNRLYEEFHCDDIPLVSMDMRYKLARLSAAVAFLTISSDDDLRIVTVTKDHVKAVVDFIEREYMKAGLGILSSEAKYETLDESDAETIIKGMKSTKGCEDFDDQKIDAIFSEFIRGTKRNILMAKFNLKDNNQARPLLTFLETQELVKITGKGLYATRKLIQLYKVRSDLTKANASTTPVKGYPNNPESEQMTKALNATDQEKSKTESPATDIALEKVSAGGSEGASIFRVGKVVSLGSNGPESSIVAEDDELSCKEHALKFATTAGKRHHLAESHLE